MKLDGDKPEGDTQSRKENSLGQTIHCSKDL